MTMEQWASSNEAYIAGFTLVAFALALWFTITCIYQGVGMMIMWHHDECRYDLKYGKASLQLASAWSVFAILKYFLGVIR